MATADKVLIYGVNTPIGLAMTRELHQHGVEVHGIGGSSRAVGLYSRALHRGYVFRGPPEARLDFVRNIAREHGIPFLMTVAESDIQFFNAHRDALPELTCLFPDRERMDRVLNKDHCYRVARAQGIEVPESHALEDLGALEALLPALTYPVILKWANPHAVAAGLRDLGLPLEKLEYSYDAADLRRRLERYRPLGRYPLLQSFCPGHGLGQMVFMHRGEPLLTFQHRRLHEWPPEGGFSTLCESLPAAAHGELLERSVALLRALDWEGPAMVEYRYDPDTGRAALMEINGRFWGSLPLAWHAGAPFVWYSYAVLGKGQIPGPRPYRAGLRCVYMIPELKRLAVILFAPDRIRNKALRFSRARETLALLGGLLDPRRRYYLFTLSDPLPALRDGGHALAKGLRLG